MSTRRARVVVAALAVVGACGSETSVSPAVTEEVATSAARLPDTTALTTVSGASSSTIPDDAASRWTQDMQALGDGVRRIHPNPFWRQSEAEFDASLAAAPAHLATLDDADARAEVMRLTARIDGHSGLYLSDAGFHLYAIHLYDFGGEFAIIAATDPTLAGATVLSINGVPISRAAAAVAPYSPFDNAATIELVVPTLLTTPEVLHAAGVIDQMETPHFVVRLTDGTERTIDPDQLSWGEFTAIDPRPIGLTKIESIPALARLDEPFWTAVLDTPPGDGETLYLQYNEVVRTSGSRTIEQLADEIDMTLDGGSITRLVVDLRYNPGGNDRTYTPLLNVLTTNPVLAHPGSLVVLIGRQTFSAAALLATELDKRTNAVFVGEPTGGSPNLYANPRPLTLPNSGIVVNVSSKYYEVGGPDDHRDAVVPDVAVTAGLDDFRRGADPVLDAAARVRGTSRSGGSGTLVHVERIAKPDLCSPCALSDTPPSVRHFVDRPDRPQGSMSHR